MRRSTTSSSAIASGWAVSREWRGGIERLDQISTDEFADLRAAREIEDARILGFVSGLSDETIGGTLRYRNMAGESHETPLAWGAGAFLQSPDPPSRTDSRHAPGTPWRRRHST